VGLLKFGIEGAKIKTQAGRQLTDNDPGLPFSVENKVQFLSNWR